MSTMHIFQNRTDIAASVPQRIPEPGHLSPTRWIVLCVYQLIHNKTNNIDFMTCHVHNRHATEMTKTNPNVQCIIAYPNTQLIGMLI